jgi:hypothetical protein
MTFSVTAGLRIMAKRVQAASPRSGDALRLIGAARADARGATALEFALIAPLLLLLLLGTIELGMVSAADILLKNAAYNGARSGRTGYVPKGVTQDKVIRDAVKQRIGILMDPGKVAVVAQAYSGFDTLGKPEPFTDANGNGTRDNGENYIDVNKNGTYDLDQGAAGYGGANQVVLYSVSYPWRFFTPMVSKLMTADGVLTLSATAVVQNEPY